MASITCTNCGAKLNTKNPVAAGKKVNCPKCKKPFVVEDEEEPEEEEVADEAGEEEEEPAPKKKPMKPAAAKREEEEDDEEEEENEDEDDAPKKKGKPDPKAKKKGKPDDDEDEDEKPKKKGGSGMLIGIIVGLLLLCCVGTSITSWFLQATIKGMFGITDAIAKAKDLPPKDMVPKDQLPTDAKDKDAKDKDNKDTKDKDIGKPLALKADMTVSPEQFAGEIDKDPVNGGKKYQGKVIEFTGELKELAFGGDKLAVSIYGGYFSNMEYRLNVPVQPTDRKIAYRLSKGQLVKVVAPYKGDGLLRFINFDMGILTEVSKSKIREVTGEQLAAEYENAAGAADEKFRDKGFLVAATVTEVKKGPDGKLEASIKGGPKVSIKVVANELGSDKVDKLTAGKTTVIRVEGCYYNFEKNLITLGKFIATDLEPGKTPEPPGPQQMKFTVESLARDVAENRNNFATKYAGNEAVISGIVEQVKKVKTVTTVDFLTNSKVKVSATFVGGKISATKGGTIEFRVQMENVHLDGMDIRFFSAKLEK